MDQKTWVKIEAIVDGVLILEKRDWYSKAKKACGNDKKLFQEVELWLQAIRQADENKFLER